MGDAFDAAAEHLRRGETAQALVEFVAHWRVTRSPHTARIIDLISPLAPDDVHRALATVISKRAEDTARNFDALRSTDDPRVSKFALDALANPPVCTSPGQIFLLACAESILRLRDSRLLAEFPHLRKVARARLTQKHLAVELEKRLAQVGKELTRPPEPTDAETRLLATLKPARTAEDLLAAIYESPNDDAPRRVYADFLLERGDPRGEFIALQLDRARDDEPTEREKKLLAKHGKEWLGPLSIVVAWGKRATHTRFDRGFLSVAELVDAPNKKLRLLTTEPSWATVEKIVRDGWLKDFLSKAPLRALTHYQGNLSGYFGDIEPASAGEESKPQIDVTTLRNVMPNLQTLTTLAFLPREDALVRFAQADIKRIVLRAWYAAGIGVPGEMDRFTGALRQLDGLPARIDEFVIYGPLLYPPPNESPAAVFLRDADGKLRRRDS